MRYSPRAANGEILPTTVPRWSIWKLRIWISARSVLAKYGKFKVEKNADRFSELCSTKGSTQCFRFVKGAFDMS